MFWQCHTNSSIMKNIFKYPRGIYQATPMPAGQISNFKVDMSIVVGAKDKSL